MGIPGAMHGKEIRRKPTFVPDPVTHDEGFWHADTKAERLGCYICNPDHPDNR